MSFDLLIIIPFYKDDLSLNKTIECLKISSYNKAERFVRNNSEDNILYTAAVNEGFRVGMLKTKIQYFLVLNQDCFLAPDAIDLLVSHMNDHPACGIACPLQTDDAGNVTWGGSLRAFPTGVHLHLPIDQYVRPFPTYWANGACMLIRRSVVEEIGNFDKNMRFICSDADFSLTARTRGWEVHVVPAARAEHSLNASGKSGPPELELVKAQDALYFYDKWISGGLYRRVSYEGNSASNADTEAWVESLRSQVTKATENMNMPSFSSPNSDIRSMLEN